MTFSSFVQNIDFVSNEYIRYKRMEYELLDWVDIKKATLERFVSKSKFNGYIGNEYRKNKLELVIV